MEVEYWVGLFWPGSKMGSSSVPSTNLRISGYRKQDRVNLLFITTFEELLSTRN